MNWNKLKCFLFGHKYAPDIWFSTNCQKIKCNRCKEKFGICHDVRAVLLWDQELEETMRLIYPEKFEK